MIYTVTLNPSLDYVIRVDQFRPGQINRNKEEHIYCGGKGINVSWILNELGYQSTCLGFTAGFTGKALCDELNRQGIRSDFIEVSEGMTRINVKMKSDEETEINGTGPLIKPEDFNALIKKTASLNHDDILVLSGSIPSCMSSDAYERILQELPEGVPAVVDAEKDLLLNVLKFHPFLIKPNNLELGAMFSADIRSKEDVIRYARKLQERGARNVLVSMAKDGAVLIDETGHTASIGVAEGTVVNSVGAGDSMVAGFLAGYLETNDYAYALKLGTACGGATAFHSGLASREEIEAVLARLH